MATTIERTRETIEQRFPDFDFSALEILEGMARALAEYGFIEQVGRVAGQADKNALSSVIQVYSSLDPVQNDVAVYRRFADYAIDNRRDPAALRSLAVVAEEEGEFLRTQPSETIFPLALIMAEARAAPELEKVVPMLKEMDTDFAEMNNLATLYFHSKYRKRLDSAGQNRMGLFYDGLRRIDDAKTLGRWANEVMRLWATQNLALEDAYQQAGDTCLE